MKKWFLVLIMVFSITSLAMAQTQPQTPVDPLDPTPYIQQLEKDGIPTPDLVGKLKNVAVGLFDAGNWKDAIPALDAHRKAANWLANLISIGNEPYYDATRKEQERVAGTNLSSLAIFEDLANGYKSDRDHSSIMIAECYAKLDDKKNAIATYIAVLKLIDVDDWLWWNRARLGLYALLGLGKTGKG